LLDSEQERRAMGAAARQLVEEQYSFASIGRLLVDAIEQVAGETCNNI
jgi:glycosyltransferase involved in cell wall biosynthesis